MTAVLRLYDKPDIRRRLETDRVWSLYALADLDEPLFAQCEWWGHDDGLALVFTGIAIHPIFVLGKPDTARALLAALPAESGYLNLREEQLPAADGVYEFRQRHRMHRMMINKLRPRAGGTVPLGSEHRAEIEALYATGDGGGIAFAPFQLDTGFFRGVRRAGELVAVAGIHVVSHSEGVGGIGNIFTRPDCRGHGLAQIATSAVVEALLTAGIRTIGLNVEDGNLPAIAAYRRLGFRTEFLYFEGPARRVR